MVAANGKQAAVHKKSRAWPAPTQRQPVPTLGFTAFSPTYPLAGANHVGARLRAMASASPGRGQTGSYPFFFLGRTYSTRLWSAIS